MRRIILMATLALVVAAMLALAGPAFAAIHPLARMECASDAAQNGRAEEVVQDQDPPGLEGQSNADNEMQSIRSVSKNDTAKSHAFKEDVCPAQNK